MTSEKVKNEIDQEILRSNDVIERHIKNLEFSNRGAVSQDVLQNLRTFLQTIMLRVYAEHSEVKHNFGKGYEELDEATKKIKGQKPFFGKFYDSLQIVASHYILGPENAERVMLKYMEYLIKIKNFAKEDLGLTLLGNLEKFPINIDKNLQKYYDAIAQRIDNQAVKEDVHRKDTGSDRYYIHKIKPFFVNQKIYYEVSFNLADERASKSDRLIAFTDVDISRYYAAKFSLIADRIHILERQLPIWIIQRWEVAIRPSEIEKFGNILGVNLKGSIGSAEGRGLMLYLTKTGKSLVDLITSPNKYYNNVKKRILEKYNARTSNIFNAFDQCRLIISKRKQGEVVLRYLLLHLNNQILKEQFSGSVYDSRTGNYVQKGNSFLSGLYLSNGCIPFEKMPFATSLIRHNPKLVDLLECIDVTNRQHELLARVIKENTEQEGILYTRKKELKQFKDVDNLVKTFNSRLYCKHRPNRELREFKEYLYVYGDQEATIFTLKKLIKMSKEGLFGYSNSVRSWLQSGNANVDDEEKQIALKNMFTKSKVALIYGSAGTGKTTLIDHVSTFFKEKSRLYLAQTNPAVDNMKHRVVAQSASTNFLTIAKFLNNKTNEVNYDVLIIDECSTVSNEDIQSILKKANFELIVLVGDTYQIESIRFGNWFSLAKEFVPTTSITELKKPFRSSNADLQTFWDKVRKNSAYIQEVDARLQYSVSFDKTIFKQFDSDEIVLCLNYDGLYGINNINSLLQENNPQEKFEWGLKIYKINDPVLFKDSDRFRPVIYNNLKGWIRNIKRIGEDIQFDIEIDKSLTELDVRGSGLKLIENASSTNSVIRFIVEGRKTLYGDDESSDSATVVPFQVAYAVSIHKSQGLEYNSVKIVITDEVGERITHSIFYTAITRARKSLKIYWSPETEQKIIRELKPRNVKPDYYLLKQRIDEEI